MKRKASAAAAYQTPAKLSKRSTTTTVSSRLSTIRRRKTSVRKPLPPPVWPSISSSQVPGVNRLHSPGPDVLRSDVAKRGSVASTSVTEISEESPVPGLRRLSTVPLEDKSGSESKSRGSELSSDKMPAVVTLERKTSVITLDASGSVTTITRLASGSSVGETTALSATSPSLRSELVKASSTTPNELVKASITTPNKGPSTSGPLTAEEVTADLNTSRENCTISMPRENPTELSLHTSIVKLGENLPELSPHTSIAKPGENPPELSLHTFIAKLGENPPKLSPHPSIAKPGEPPLELPPLITSAPQVAVPLPPGGLIEIAFSFDTTGSMSSCIDEVRGRVGDMIQRLQADIPGIRIAVIAHGDYCDEHNYVIKWIDFGASLPELSDFLHTVSTTGGGDFDECYELVMARARTELSWTPGSQRSLVMIGDATPHPPSFYSTRVEKLDWTEEAQKLSVMGVKIYAVQALNRNESTSFYRAIAAVTRGRHLKLDQFNNIFDIIMAVCYHEKGVEFVQAYEEEVRTREGGRHLHSDLEGLFSAFTTAGAILLPSPGTSSRKTSAKRAPKRKKVPAAGKRTAARGKAKTAAAKRKRRKSTMAKGRKSRTASAEGHTAEATEEKRTKDKKKGKAASEAGATGSGSTTDKERTRDAAAVEEAAKAKKTRAKRRTKKAKAVAAGSLSEIEKRKKSIAASVEEARKTNKKSRAKRRTKKAKETSKGKNQNAAPAGQTAKTVKNRTRAKTTKRKRKKAQAETQPGARGSVSNMEKSKKRSRTPEAVPGTSKASKETRAKTRTSKKKAKAETKARVKAAVKEARDEGTKYVKGRKLGKRQRRKKTVTAKVNKPRRLVPGVKRKFREAVVDQELSQGSCLRKVKWTPWFKAIIPSTPRPKGRAARLFKLRNLQAGPGKPPVSAALQREGLRHTRLCNRDQQNAPAIYEIAVQLKPSKRYVVFFKACTSWKSRRPWDNIILNTPELRQEVNAILKAGGQIWLRRGTVKNHDHLKAVSQHIDQHYDYAWQKRKSRGGVINHRRVKKCRTVISGN